MTRDRLIDAMQSAAEAIRAEGATSLYLYGSRARDDGRADSDVDVFVDYLPDSGFSLLELAGIQNVLAEKTGLEISITTANSLHPKLRDRIMQEAIRIL